MKSKTVLFVLFSFFVIGILGVEANSNVHVTRFWHNHQPIYWPEWNSGVGQDSRVQYAHDSMRLKPTQNYGAAWNHPHNNLEEIFGNHDRIAAYQGRPRDSVAAIGQAGGMAMSYTGSLIDNIRNLAANGWNYGGNWNQGNTEARQWTTTRGGPRLDMVGFSYHHSLTPLLPKEVFRKEVQIFKEAWWKAWGGASDKTDHSKGFFPTEMAYSRDIIDVLVDEGYEWVIVASHHISRTSPSYMDRITPNFDINSSPPNRADMLGPRFDNASQWWREEPNPGQAAWNVAPFAYQLHRVEYVDPETGDVKSMIAVPSDDVLSYQAGYSGAQIGLVDSQIAPHADDPNRPVLVMPATDGDNAWGGGFDSWMVSTPSFFGAAQSQGYQINSIQDFVNQFKEHAPTTHIEEGAWIYPEMCYGSPYFLKWIEPPVRLTPNSPTTYPNTQIDIENGWALKFFAYAPKMAGANWVITAEQIKRKQGGEVEAWKIQAPYDWDGTWTEPNEVELAWHIYLKGLDSGFQYYGGLGNDDETKPGLAARRTIETLQDWMSTRMDLDETGPTVLKPQRFPYNPGGWTFGWFNRVPQGDENFLKKHPSWFYIWTLAHDVSGIERMELKIRHTHNNENFRNGHHDNLTYAGGAHVSDWVTIPMTKRVLPNTREALNAIASHGEIDFVVTSPEIADQYFVKIDDSVYPDFRGRYFDYYIEAEDTRGNVTRTEIQHVFVEDDGEVPSSYAQFSADPRDCAPLGVTYHAANGPLEGVSPVFMQIQFDSGAFTRYEMTNTATDVWNFALEVPGKPSSATVYFENANATTTDNRGGQNWTTSIRDCDAPVGPRIVEWDPQTPDGCDVDVTIRYYPNEGPLQGLTPIRIHIGRNGWVDTETIEMSHEGIYWEHIYTVPDDTYEINMAFNGGAGPTWDDNNGNDWKITVINCSEDGPLPTVSTVPAEPEGCNPVTIRYNPSGRTLSGAEQVYIHIGRNGWQGVIEPNPAMTWEGNHWSYTYDPMTAGTEVLNFVFNDGDGNWDNNGGQNWFVNITGCDEDPEIPTDLAITNPPGNIVVGHAVDSYTLEGIAEGVVSDISWSNALTGASGDFPSATPWTLSDVALAVGANVITVRGEVPGSGDSDIIAQDSVGPYSGGWSSGDNRGSGFGAWVLNADSNAGHWSTDPRGWGMWSHEGGNLAEAIRPFGSALDVDQTFRVRMHNGWIWDPEEGTPGSVGVALRNAGGDTLWEFYFNGGDDHYSITGDTTDIGWTDEGLNIAFTLTGPDSYSVEVHPDGDSARTYTGTFENGPITQFRAWSSNNGTSDEHNSNRDYFFNNLSITEPGSGDTQVISHSVTITREDDGEPPPEPGLFITVPATDITVGHGTDTYTLSGTAVDLAGDILWTNALTGGSDSIAVVTLWTIADVPLAVGTNVITVSGEIPGGGEEVVGEDRADNYETETWTNGSNQATGAFGVWNMWDGGDDSGTFVWDSTENGHGDINTDGVAFGMFGHSGQYSDAQRGITEWGDGYTFSIDLAVQWRDGASGLNLYNTSDTGEMDEPTQIWNFNISNDGYGGSGFDYSSDIILNVAVTQNGANLDIVVTGSSANDSWSDTWSTTVTGENLGGFRLYTGGDFPPGEEGPPQDAGERNLYFNNFTVTAPGAGEPTPVSDTVTITRLADDDETDTNEDGVPDSFYIENGLDPTDPDVGQTPAPNGYTYRASYFMNLDPNDDETPPFRMLMNGEGKFTFEAPTGLVYQVQYKDNLMYPLWSNLHDIVVGEDIEDSENVPHRFYRVRFPFPGE